MKKQKISKELILEITKGGILFFLQTIKDLQVEGDKCKNVLNPFYPDTKPSLSIYRVDGQWFFKDHGSPEFSGDVFQWAAYHFDLDVSDNFPEILNLLYELDYTKVLYKEVKTSSKANDENRPFELERRLNDSFRSHELNYFGQYGISEETLRAYQVVPIDGYSSVNSKGKEYQVSRKKRQILVAYLHEVGAKIYSPDPKDFAHVGSKPSNFIFGENAIDEHDEKTIIFTSGEKDAMTISGLGYPGVSLNSETATTIPQDFLKFYSEQGYKFLILYDNDSTGRKYSELLSEKYGISKLAIPSSILNRGGKDISEYVQLGLTKKLFDKFVIKAVKSTSNPAQTEENENGQMANPSEAELIPLDVFQQLPDFLKKCCNSVDEIQDKSLILLSSIALLGGVIRNVTGKYDYNTAGTNLYLFVVAPASSGKGVMKYPKMLGNKIHQSLKSASVDTSDDKEKPRQTFFIPANSSSSSILSQLAHNNGYGMLWETEADTLNDTLSKEWGNFSDCLRKAFHHEHISYQRKTNNEFVEIEYPNLGLVLSGTPNQVNGLINSAENGLFSRMMFLDFKGKNKWNTKLHLSQRNFDIGKHFNSLGEEVYELFERLLDLEEAIDFTFTDDQWGVFHEYFEEWFTNSNNLFGEEILASIKRLGLITFKIAMVLSTCRLMQEDELPKTISCRNEDFETAIKIASCCKSHMVSVYSRLITKDKTARLSNLEQVSYYESLPDDFTKKMSRSVADSIGLKHKTAENHIDLYIEKNMLVRYAHGKYRKVI